MHRPVPTPPDFQTVFNAAPDLSAAEREDLLRHVQTIVPKSGAEAILTALGRLGLGNGRADVGTDGKAGPR